MSKLNYSIKPIVIIIAFFGLALLSGCWSSCSADHYSGVRIDDSGAQAVATRTILLANIQATATSQAVYAAATRQIDENNSYEAVQTADVTGRALSAFGIGVGGLVLSVGLAFGLVAWVNKRATSIYPNRQGQYPIVVRHGPGYIAFHDPSRNVGPGAIYRTPGMIERSAWAIATLRGQHVPLPTPEGMYPLPEISESSLAQVAGQSNAVALTAAEHRWPQIPAITFGGRSPIMTAPEIEHHPLPMAVTQPQPAIIEFPTRIPLKYMLNNNQPSLQHLALGVTVREGQQIQSIYANLADMVHVLAAGASGWGKSQFLKMLIYQLATAQETCQLALADMERTTFGAFSRCDRLMFPIVDNERDLAAVMHELTGELERRKELFAQHPDVDKLPTYNQVANDPLRPVILAIDEATSFLIDNSVSDGLKMLVRRGRKYGLWVTAGGQTFSARDVDTATSLQFSSRIQFRAPVKSGSQTLVDSKDAKSLECPGRAILVLPGHDPIKIQTPTVSYDEIMAAFSGASGPSHAIPDATDAQDVQVRRLAEDGMTPSQIAEQIFGYKNSRTVDRVRSILGDTSE